MQQRVAASGVRWRNVFDNEEFETRSLKSGKEKIEVPPQEAPKTLEEHLADIGADYIVAFSETTGKTISLCPSGTKKVYSISDPGDLAVQAFEITRVEAPVSVLFKGPEGCRLVCTGNRCRIVC